MKNFFTKNIIYKLVFILIGVVIGVAIAHSYFPSSGDATGLAANTNDAQVIQKTIDDLSKLMILPKDESPVVATINDASKLIAQQPFYADAINGDIIIVYQKSLKAIIYSPSRNIIVNVGFISQDSAASASTTPATSASQSQSTTSNTTATSTKKK